MSSAREDLGYTMPETSDGPHDPFVRRGDAWVCRGCDRTLDEYERRGHARRCEEWLASFEMAAKMPKRPYLPRDWPGLRWALRQQLRFGVKCVRLVLEGLRERRPRESTRTVVQLDEMIAALEAFDAAFVQYRLNQ